jgi:hypothetical protein
VVSDDIDKIRWIGDWSILLAGAVTRADELVGEFYREFESAQGTHEKLYDFRERVKLPVHRQERKIIEEYVQLSLGISYDQFLAGGKDWFPESVYFETYNGIRQLTLDAEVILARCMDDTTTLIRVDRLGTVHWESNFAVIGSGATIASGALCQREYDPNMDLMECLYRVYEAKRLGQASPGVGETTKIEILTPGKRQYISTRGYNYLEKKFEDLGPSPKIPKIRFSERYVEPAETFDNVSGPI